MPFPAPQRDAGSRPSIRRIDPRIGDLLRRPRRRRRALPCRTRPAPAPPPARAAPRARSRQHAPASAPPAPRRWPARCRRSWCARRPRPRPSARENTVCGDARLHRLHLGQRQVGQIDALRLGPRHQPAGDVMRVAERQLQHAHQPVGQIGRGGEAGAGELRASARCRASCRAPCRRSRRATAPRRRRRRTPAPCPPACPWRRPAAGPSSPSAAPTSAPVMRPVLARTSSAASGLRFCGMIELPVVNASDSRMKRNGALHQITISSAKRDRCIGRDRGGGQEFQREIAVRDGVERVGRRPVEAERRGGHVAVDRERRAGQRRRAQRAFVQPPAAIGQPAAVAAPASRHRPADDGRTSPAARSADG